MGFTLCVNPYLVIAFIMMLVTFIYRYMQDLYTTLERLGIPGPKPVWVFGNVLEFKGKNVLEVFNEWKKKYGTVYGFYEGFRPGIVVNDVELAKDILSANFEKFHVRTSYRPFVYYPENLRLIEIDGEHWKYQRAVINKMLGSPGAMKIVVEKTQIASCTLMQKMKDDLMNSPDEINIEVPVDSYVSEAVMRIVLNFDDEQLSKYRETIYKYEKLSDWSSAADNEASGLARLFPSLTPLLRLTDKEHKEYHNVVVSILRDYLNQTLKGQNNNTLKEDEHPSLTSYLLSSKVLCRDIDGSLTRRDLATDETIAHILSLLSEMYTTTTAAIQFMLYELACNPKCQEKLYDEILRVCGKDEDIKLSDLHAMEYFEMFFSETYRHHPIAPGVSRICTESCKIRDVRFKKGMVIRVMTSPIYQDECFFPEPKKFIPERFSKENRKDSHQYSFLPFGQGPRVCPGSKLAMCLVKAPIINILKKYSLEISKNTEFPLKEALRPSLTPANGVYLRLSERK